MGRVDPDANFKSEVTLYARLDPLVTLRGLSRRTGIPIGALAHYVLAKLATAGSGGLMEVVPEMVHRLWEPLAEAERIGTDEARLAAFDKVKGMLSWLKVPLDDPSVYDLPARRPSEPATEPSGGAVGSPGRSAG